VSDGGEGFLARWSRRKAGAARGEPEREQKPGEAATEADRTPAAKTAAGTPLVEAARRTPATGAVAGAAPLGVTPAASVARDAPAAEPLPTLADVARLGRDSDYSPFVRAGVDPAVKNAALKKLFTDPHFNIMDGLDIYIDDYGKPDPIPPDMLRQLNQARNLGLFDEPAEGEASAAVEDNAAFSAAAAPDGPAAVTQSVPPPATDDANSAAVPASPAATLATSHDDPDLRLQQDDGAGCSGAAPGARA
jgi:hypothetical protein